MIKSDVIRKIARRLEDESPLNLDLIDETIVLHLEDAIDIISEVLDEYTLVRGEVVEN